LGQLKELARQPLERRHRLEGRRGLRHHCASVLELRELGQIKGHLLLCLVQPSLVRLTELRLMAVLKVLQPLRHLFHPHDELGELVGAGICAGREVALWVHRRHQWPQLWSHGALLSSACGDSGRRAGRWCVTCPDVPSQLG
jgi:hypothetical protein